MKPARLFGRTNAADEPPPLGLAQVLAEEARVLHPQFAFDEVEDTKPQGAAEYERKRLASVVARIHRDCPDRAALCLSGGGIRSATFALGVLQGLAWHGLLERFTYLSTVSGGGYIGSWLSAWIHREHDDPKAVRDALVASVSRCGPEPAPIAMLRAYSNYLTPQLGLFSADTWTLISTVLRNLLLNWFVIVPPVAIALTLPRFLRELLALEWHPAATSPLLVLGCLLLLLPIAYIDLDLPSAGNHRWTQRRFLWCSLVPLILSAALLASYWGLARFAAGQGRIDPQHPVAEPALGVFVAFGVVIHLAGWILGRVASLATGATAPRGPTLWEIISIAAVGALGGWVLWLLLPDQVDPANRWYFVLSVPTLLALYLLATTAYVGLASKSTTDEDREWWARAGAWVLIAGLAWLVVMAAAILGPDLVRWLWQGSITSVSMLGTAGVSGIVTWIAGRSAKTPSGTKAPSASADESVGKQGAAMQWALAVAAPLFVVSLVLLIGFLADEVFRHFHASFGRWWAGDGFIPNDPAAIATDLAAFLVVLAGLTALASRKVNVNRFSLHAMYRNRLIGAYLGAPRYGGGGGGRRRPSPFTGFDEDDNLRMHELAGVRPFHVINIALNLVRGRRLAWQHRKAASFSVTALHCGSSAPSEKDRVLGYQSSKTYGNPGKDGGGGLSLGTALAISGAAVSPNMGYHSSPVVGLLLTAFNGRLGWWLANPGDAGRGRWTSDGPRWALRSLFAEALGLTDEHNPYVYLSDGGHFENLGLYEMVLRRCRSIVVVDGGCDGKEQFEDLGNALRKIRIDLGIEIEWTSTAPAPGTATGTRIFTARILYSRCDGVGPEKDGRLVVLKPVVEKTDPVDVGTYKRLHVAFPHESTGDQWFDEEQFESYRRLGLVTCELAKGDVTFALAHANAKRARTPNQLDELEPLVCN